MLGLIINRTGSDEEQGYYGYHSYGYSYGDGDYSYGEEYDDEEQTLANAGEAECVPFAAGTEGVADEERSRPLLIPRRVA